MGVPICLLRLPAHGSAHQKLSLAEATTLGQIATFWESNWSAQLLSQGVTSGPGIIEFFRADTIFGLFSGNEPIGVMTSTLFDFRSSFHHRISYFQKYPKKVLKHFLALPDPRFMTMEYLYIHPRWRTSQIQLSLGVVLCLVGLMTFLDTNAHNVITVPRTDRAIGAQLYQYGAQALFRNEWLYNSYVDYVSFSRETFEAIDTIETRLARALLRDGTAFVTRKLPADNLHSNDSAMLESVLNKAETVRTQSAVAGEPRASL